MNQMVATCGDISQKRSQPDSTDVQRRADEIECERSAHLKIVRNLAPLLWTFVDYAAQRSKAIEEVQFGLECSCAS